MMRITNLGNARRLVYVFAVVLCMSAGCERESQDEPSVSVTILYEGMPLANVNVRLHDGLDGPMLAQSITRDDGRALIANVPSPEPDQYFVSLESISDGGWILDSRAIQRSGSVFKLMPFREKPQQEIELPPRSIKPL